MAFCNLDSNNIIGDSAELKSHISITGNTNIGKNNILFFSNMDVIHKIWNTGEDSFWEIVIQIYLENVQLVKALKMGEW